METSYAFISSIQLKLWLVEIKQQSVSGDADA
jgi:hypothetical protein